MAGGWIGWWMYTRGKEMPEQKTKTHTKAYTPAHRSVVVVVRLNETYDPRITPLTSQLNVEHRLIDGPGPHQYLYYIDMDSKVLLHPTRFHN